MFRKWLIILLGCMISLPQMLMSQCSMCTKTASQLGEKPALGLNTGIIYLMLAPFLVIGYIGYRWWKNRTEL